MRTIESHHWQGFLLSSMSVQFSIVRRGQHAYAKHSMPSLSGFVMTLGNFDVSHHRSLLIQRNVGGLYFQVFREDCSL